MSPLNHYIHELTSARWSLQNAETNLRLLVGQTKLSPHGVADQPEFSAIQHQANNPFSHNQERSSTLYVAVLPIIGVITKYQTWGGYGTTIYAREIIKAAHNDEICGLVISIDSPGGNLNAIPAIKSAIEIFKSTKKPIVAHSSICNSAAYWIASQCDMIYAESEMSEFGSIGMFSTIMDYGGRFEKEGIKVHTIYAEESPDKNLAQREALNGEYKLIKEKMTPLIKVFHNDVKVGRTGRLKADEDGVLTGATFLAPEAIKSGLVDSIQTLDQVIQNVIVMSNFKK